MLADHTNWGEVGFSTFAQLSDADLLITDDLLPKEAIDILRRHVAEVAVVST